MAYILEIGFQVGNHSFPFPDKESANAALALLTPKVGFRAYGANGERDRSFAIETPAGKVVVDLEKIQFAAVIDTEARVSLMADMVRRDEAEKIDFEVRKRKALMAVSV